MVKEAAGDVLIQLLVLACYIAPAGIAAFRFVSLWLRTGARHVQIRLAHAAPLILSGAHSLFQRLARIAAMMAERAGIAWLEGSRRTSAAFSSLLMQAGYGCLVLASYAVPALKGAGGASRRIFVASRQRASEEAARVMAAISVGSAWLKRRGVPLLKLAGARTARAIKSGFAYTSAATKAALAQVRTGSMSLARKFELDRRTAALLSTSRAARDRAIPMLMYGLNRTSRVTRIAWVRCGAASASLMQRLELPRHTSALLAASRRAHARIAAISHDYLGKAAHVTGAGFRSGRNLLVKAFRRQGNGLPAHRTDQPDLY